MFWVFAYAFSSNETRGNNLNNIQLASQKTYGDKICRLLFNLIRSMTPTWSTPVRYPVLDSSQIETLQTLRDELHQDDQDAIDTAFHNACYILYAHERHQYSCSAHLHTFFSPVNMFLVFSSLRADGTFCPASEITQMCAALEYSIRSVMLVEIDCISKIKSTKTFESVFFFHLF